MATVPLEPPHPGWHYDEKTRGWFAPGYASYAQAPASAKISRRQYDKEFGRLKKQGFKSNEEQVTARNEAGIRKRSAISPGYKVHFSHGWYTAEFSTLGALAVQVRRIPHGFWYMVSARGIPRTTSPKDDEETSEQYRPLIQVELTDEFNAARVDELSNAAERLFESVSTWILRWKARGIRAQRKTAQA